MYMARLFIFLPKLRNQPKVIKNVTLLGYTDLCNTFRDTVAIFARRMKLKYHATFNGDVRPKPRTTR